MAAASLGWWVGGANKIRYHPWEEGTRNIGVGGRPTTTTRPYRNTLSSSGCTSRRSGASSVRPARASDDKSPGGTTPQQDEASPPTLLPKEEDWDYLWKLGVGSLVGAAVIKYGSALFPDITTPNLPVALFIISTPVVVATLLLFNLSRS